MSQASNRDHSVETPYGWFVVAASLGYLVIAYGSSHLVIVSLKPMVDLYDWPRWIPSLAYSALMIGAGVGGIVMGLWADKTSIRWPAMVGAVMVGGGVLVASYAPDHWTLIASCGLLVGLLGTSTAFSPMLANITRWFDRRRGLAIAITASGQALAGAVWPLIFEPRIAAVGWQETWREYGIVAIAIMLPITFAFRRPVPRQPDGGAGIARGRSQGAATTAATPAVPYNLVLAILSLAIVGCCVAMAMPMVHLIAYCSDLGLSSASGARMLSLLLFCSAVSRLLFGIVSDRIGGLKTILFGSAAQAVTLGMFTLVGTEASLYAVSGLFGLVFGGIVPAYALAVRELFPARDTGWRMGVVFLFGTGGMALGGFLGGWIFDLAGHYHIAFLVGVAFNVVNLMAIITLLRFKGPRAPALAPA
jgi:MFS family permease